MNLPDRSVYLQAIERELKNATAPDAFASDAHYRDFFNIFQYHLGWMDTDGRESLGETGKRFRPLLCVWCCQAVGGRWREALPAGSALELVHNFSLIHDDIQDNSLFRHGRATVWKVWGVPQAINAGDAMFVLARLALDGVSQVLSPEAYRSVQHRFDTATFAITRGQFLDLRFENSARVTVEDYFTMVRGKTAALVSASAEIGARIGTQDVGVIQAMARYGENLGIAFQIIDDLLGIWGDPEITGKSAASDLLAKKKSLPVLIARQRTAENQLENYFGGGELASAEISRVLDLLDQTGARSAAEAEAQKYLDRALLALDETGLDNPAVLRLSELAHSAVERVK